jgi:hypothetical protein
VSKRVVHRGAQAYISRYSPATSVISKSAGRGAEAAADVAEESASSDCASEGAGEVCSSTAVSMTADMMRCVHRRSKKVREEKWRDEWDRLREMDLWKLRIIASRSIEASFWV